MNPGINKNSSKKSISIIVPFLNGEKFIQEAIESVFAQTYSHWELFLIDDGSTDGSTKIARQYAEEYPQKVTYIEHANHKSLGAAASRNVGIDKSNGEYIAFLDADDVWLPQKLKEQIEIMHAHPEVAMVYGLAFYWFSWTGKPEDAIKDYTQDLHMEYDSVVKPPLALRKLIEKGNYCPMLCSLLISRKAISRGGKFEESFPIVLDDQAFFIKILLAEPVFVASKVWHKYRQHPDSSCNSIAKEKHLAMSLRFWTWAKKYLTKKGFKEKEGILRIEGRIRKRRLGQFG